MEAVVLFKEVGSATLKNNCSLSVHAFVYITHARFSVLLCRNSQMEAKTLRASSKFLLLNLSPGKALTIINTTRAYEVEQELNLVCSNLLIAMALRSMR